jgi:DNA-binding transcriptional MocR family regulator
MARGKPCHEQLDISMGMMDALNSEADLSCEDGTDCRNYGVLDGIYEAKVLIGAMMENKPENIIIYGNSSLNVMYDTVSRAYTHGIMGNTPWCKLDKVKFLCPVPGYDRHFAITEYFGIDMIPVPMTPDGPDMDTVEKLVAEDDSIKGIWCVPKYSNPQGYSYSDETVRRFARPKPAAQDFRIFWDNAYVVHHLYEDRSTWGQLPDMLSLCEKYGNANRVYEFASSSKITFAGGGISCFAANKDNMTWAKRFLNAQAICTNKVNQLAHARFLPDAESVYAHMMKHAAILRPKFEACQKVLNEELGFDDLWHWTKPNGGYFVSFYAMPGTATKIVTMCKEAGVALTPAGASYPYGKDPSDSNIRLAPSFPGIEDIEKAVRILTICAKITAVDKLLEDL